MYFSVKCEKTQETHEKPKVFLSTLEKTQGPQKKTKNPRWNRKTQGLGRNPKEWQRCRWMNGGWFPNLTRAYDNNGRCPRQKFVFGILQLFCWMNLAFKRNYIIGATRFKGVLIEHCTVNCLLKSG